MATSTSSEFVNVVYNQTPMQQFYQDAVVLVTGSTGNLGKLLLEKLLRACPDIKKLILIIRSQKGKSAQQRIDTILDDPMYDRMKLVNPNFRDRIVTYDGDCSVDGLGLSAEDINRILSEVTVVFHIAASVKFDDPIQLAANINLRGTREILNICKQMQHLKTMVHISTAYSHCPREKIEERFYPCDRDPEEFLQFVTSVSDAELEARSAEILGEWPNTYVYTKALAEELVRRHLKDLPIVMCRPSIVTGANKEPIPGTIDNLAGPTGIVVGCAAGVIRTFYCDYEKVADIVPCDMSVNAILSLGWYRALHNGEAPMEVMNYVSSSRNPITWKGFITKLIKFGTMFPLSNSLWHYTFYQTKYSFLYTFYCFFLHTIPGYLMDIFLSLRGKKPRMLKLYQKIHNVMYRLSYFSTKQWSWDDNNVVLLWNKMDERDKRLFHFNVADIEWQEYAYFQCKYIRFNLMNDPVSTIEAAEKRMARLKLAHYTLVATLNGLFFYILYTFILKRFL